MKTFIFALLFITGTALAQEPVIVEKPLICAKTKELLNGLKNNYKELPVWVGSDEKSKYSLFVSDSGTWTLIQFNENVACILGVGENSKHIFSGPKT